MDITLQSKVILLKSPQISYKGILKKMKNAPTNEMHHAASSIKGQYLLEASGAMAEEFILNYFPAPPSILLTGPLHCCQGFFLIV